MMQPSARHAVDAPLSPPRSATASILIALTSLAISVNADSVSKHLGGTASIAISAIAPIAVSIVVILASFLSRSRLERGKPAIWIVRASAFVLTLIYALATSEHIQSFYYLNFVARIFSLSFVVECAIQHWQRPPTGQHRNAILVFLAAIVFVLASRFPTHVKANTIYLTPLFIGALAISMRAARPRVNPQYRTFPPWIAALVLATVMGGVAAQTVAAHNAEWTRLFLSLMRPPNFSDTPDVNTRPMIGRSFNLPLSQKRIFKIEGEIVERHMRGMTFETYNTNGSWIPSFEAHMRLPASDAKTSDDAGAPLTANPGGQRITVTPLIDNLPILYVPLHMAGLDAKAYRIGWSPEWRGSIFATPLKGVEPYQITIANETHPGPLTGPLSASVREHCLELPPDFDPRVQEIARQLQHGTTTPHDKLDAIRRYLGRNHSYSLTVEPGPGDPVANFIVQKRDGHCQYFAASAVLLLRCMGIPARYVTGYYAHETPQINVAMVRQRDAHAWAEVWIDGEGWQTFDTTPSGGMPGQSGAIDFWARQWERLGDWFEAFGAWLRESPVSSIALLVGLAVVLGFALNWFFAWRLTARRVVLQVKYASAGPAFDELAHAFDTWLKRKGAPCPPHCPWILHLEALKPEADPALKIDVASALAFVRDYSSARFGGVADKATVERLKEQMKSLG